MQKLPYFWNILSELYVDTNMKWLYKMINNNRGYGFSISFYCLGVINSFFYIFHDKKYEFF